MDDWYKFARRFREHWSSWQFLAIAVIVFAAIGWIVSPNIDSIFLDRGYRTAALAVFSLLGLILWHLTNGVPRARTRAIGIALAIATETEDDERHLRADFIRSFRRQIELFPGRYGLDLCVVPPHISESIRSIADAEKLRSRTRCHLLVWGRVRRRKMKNSKYGWYIELQGSVGHAAITPTNRKALQNEFSTALPLRAVVPEAGAVSRFEFTASWLDVSSRYILALAGGLSGDLPYCLESLEYCLACALDGSREAPLKLRHQIRKEVPRLMIQALEGLLANWRPLGSSNYNADALQKNRAYTRRLLELQPNNGLALSMAAMVAFVVDGDLAEAKRFAHQIPAGADAVRELSLAFLVAYDGDARRALSLYERGAKTPLADLSIPIQCDEFIQEVLTKEPDRAALYACAAAINILFKSDRALGAASLAEYERRSLEGADPEVVRRLTDALELLIVE